jgi:hypothetical protein
MLDIERYVPVARQSAVISEIGAHRAFTSFLSRTDFYARAIRNDVDAADFARRFYEESRREKSVITSIIPIDGLELTHEELTFTGGRLFRLTRAVIRSLLENGYVPGLSGLDEFEDMWAIEVTTEAPNPPWEIEWESASKQVRKLASPWLDLLNLYGSEKVRVCGAYQRTDSLFASPPVRAIGIQQPVRDPLFDEDGDFSGDTRPFITLSIEDSARLGIFLQTLSARTVEARTRTHRVDTALRFWGRVADLFWQHHAIAYGDDPDANEDLIIDAVTGVEAIFLAGETSGKGGLIASRAVPLIEADATARRILSRQISELYALRSAIVHGDDRKRADELQRGARRGEDVLRRSLVAFIMLRGDHTCLVDGARDRARAAVNRIAAAI